jgi:L-fuconolactonase
MIIDTHTHFYDPTRPQGVPWPAATDQVLYRTVLPDHCKALAAPEGVTGTVVVEASGWLEDNQWVLDLAAADPFIVGLVGHLDPDRPEFPAELSRFAANPLFRGIRCGGRYFADIEQGTFLRDMALLAAKDLQLDVLLNHDYFDGVVHLAQRLPTLRIVVNHIGLMPIDGQAIAAEWVTRYQQLASQPNVYMKVSGLIELSTIRPAPAPVEYYYPTLDVLWHAFGEDRLIYGSNWPVCEVAGTYGQCINIVKSYFQTKGETAYQKYFWQNAQAVYKWPIQ